MNVRGGVSNPTHGQDRSLTPAELRLLPYLQTHLGYPSISLRLGVSVDTVKCQAKSMYRKLGVNDREQLVQRAIALGLLEDQVARLDPTRPDYPRGRRPACAVTLMRDPVEVIEGRTGC